MRHRARVLPLALPGSCSRSVSSARLIRRNAIVIFMFVELMLNAVNLAFVTFARMWGHVDGQVLVFFVLVVAAAEVVVGLAIILLIARQKGFGECRRREPLEMVTR